jgi:cytochrome P450
MLQHVQELALCRYLNSGPVFRLSFGPKSFIIISDPVLARHILRVVPEKFSKGVLAEILEPIMGKGLIPADQEVWKQRRRAIVPAFHQAYLNAMVSMFVTCTERSVNKLQALAECGSGVAEVNMEDEFLSLGLDIIGLGVFNFDFSSVKKESAVIKAVYRCLREAVCAIVGLLYALDVLAIRQGRSYMHCDVPSLASPCAILKPVDAACTGALKTPPNFQGCLHSM